MIKKAMELIGKYPFKQLARDPTSKNEKRVNDLLKRLEKEMVRSIRNYCQH